MELMKQGIPSGISLRDWFAGMALQGMISSPPIVDRHAVNKTKWANIAYKWADAMLKAREDGAK